MQKMKSFIEKENAFVPPDSVSNVAKRILKIRDEHKSEVKGGTSVGWTRANQLANKENLSLETIKRMYSFFSRHNGNQTVDPKLKNEPWKDNGWTAWQICGGDPGYSWVKSIVDKLEESEEILDEGLISSAFNTASALMIAKKLMTKLENWDSYKFGLIDKKGNRTDKTAETQAEKESINLFNTFVLSIKKLLLFFVSEGVLKVLVSYYVIKNINKS